MYTRFIVDTLERLARSYAVVGITGPRQSGKTTIAKKCFPHLPYVSLENLDNRKQAHLDPRAFLAKYKDGAIFDEVQNTPELLSYLQQIVDESDARGRYVVTGSQNFLLNEHLTQTLPGRIGMATLLPLSLRELGSSLNINEYIFKGGYPALHRENLMVSEFYDNYIQFYIERDVRQIKNIENLMLFKSFLIHCAARVGNVLNLSSLAKDCGVSHTTIRQWLSILEASYIVFFVAPYYNNLGKRLIKMPKLYFYDTGVVCNLLGLGSEDQVEKSYFKGALFENMVALEIMKYNFEQGKRPNLYFWRDNSGFEVDLIADWDGIIRAMEIKSGSTFQSEYIKNVKHFCTLSNLAKCYLVYNGQQDGKVLGVELIPLNKLIEILD